MMSVSATYDLWISAPYTAEIEGPACPYCGAAMDWEEDADEDGRWMVTWCEECGDE